jgi:hypothetical protein
LLSPPVSFDRPDQDERPGDVIHNPRRDYTPHRAFLVSASRWRMRLGRCDHAVSPPEVVVCGFMMPLERRFKSTVTITSVTLGTARTVMGPAVSDD